MVVRAFSTLIKRPGSMPSSNVKTIAADGTIGDGKPEVIEPTGESPPSAKSTRQHLDEKAKAYAQFCRSRC